MSAPAKPKGGNPNPARITDAMWMLWEACYSFIPGVQNAGIWTDHKSGYHCDVNNNLAHWPGSYSVQLALDTQYGPRDKGRAIDLTMSDAQMRERTGYLRRAAEHPDDNRLNVLRSFIGTVDSKTVFCMIKDDDTVGNWRYDYGRDSSHLWHEHISVLTKHCATWAANVDTPGLEAVASVLSGETWEQWVARKGGGGTHVKYIQITDPVVMADGSEIGGGALYLAGVGIAWVHDPALVDDIATFWKIPYPFNADGTVAASVGKFGNIGQAQAVCGPFLGRMDALVTDDDSDGGSSGPGGVPEHEHTGGTSGPVAPAGKL